uniref:RAP domain-containing protein n=1 Tax=Neogobius melanostomus TaxID=47308 RepID=A0A8C6SKZ8_9GOBI
MTMSRAAALVMRTALHFCRQSLSLKHHSLPAVASSKLLSAPTANSPFHRPVRLFSDTQTQESDQLPRSVFVEKLSSCSSPSDVLDLTTHYSPTPSQLSHALSRMWNSLKKLTEEQRRAELRLMWEHAALEPLLQQAVGGVAHLSHIHLAYALLALAQLGVRPRTRVVQTYLRAAQERINDFDDKSLSILSSSLENLEDGANVQALKHGIRLLVEARLPRIKNVLHLQTTMRLVGKDAPLELKYKLEAKAMSLSDQFSLPNAQYMITSMVALGFSSKPLLSLCSRKISEHLSCIPFNRLLTVLVSCRELRYRDQQLLNDVSEYGASMVHVWNHKQLVLVLSCLESLYFCPESLLDSYSQLVQSDPEALTLRELLCVLRVCSSLSYHPPRYRPFTTRPGTAPLPPAQVPPLYHPPRYRPFTTRPGTAPLPPAQVPPAQVPCDVCKNVPSCHEFISSLVFPPRVCGSVAVLCVPGSAFCFGTSRPRGTLALRLRHLRVLGYRPLLVSSRIKMALKRSTKRIFNTSERFIRNCSE